MRVHCDGFLCCGRQFGQNWRMSGGEFCCLRVLFFSTAPKAGFPCPRGLFSSSLKLYDISDRVLLSHGRKADRGFDVARRNGKVYAVADDTERVRAMFPEIDHRSSSSGRGPAENSGWGGEMPTGVTAQDANERYDLASPGKERPGLLVCFGSDPRGIVRPAQGERTAEEAMCWGAVGVFFRNRSHQSHAVTREHIHTCSDRLVCFIRGNKV